MNSLLASTNGSGSPIASADAVCERLRTIDPRCCTFLDNSGVRNSRPVPLYLPAPPDTHRLHPPNMVGGRFLLDVPSFARAVDLQWRLDRASDALQAVFGSVLRMLAPCCAFSYKDSTFSANGAAPVLFDYPLPDGATLPFLSVTVHFMMVGTCPCANTVTLALPTSASDSLLGPGVCLYRFSRRSTPHVPTAALYPALAAVGLLGVSAPSAVNAALAFLHSTDDARGVRPAQLGEPTAQRMRVADDQLVPFVPAVSPASSVSHQSMSPAGFAAFPVWRPADGLFERPYVAYLSENGHPSSIPVPRYIPVPSKSGDEGRLSFVLTNSTRAPGGRLQLSLEALLRLSPEMLAPLSLMSGGANMTTLVHDLFGRFLQDGAPCCAFSFAPRDCKWLPSRCDFLVNIGGETRQVRVMTAFHFTGHCACGNKVALGMPVDHAERWCFFQFLAVSVASTQPLAQPPPQACGAAVPWLATTHSVYDQVPHDLAGCNKAGSDDGKTSSHALTLSHAGGARTAGLRATDFLCKTCDRVLACGDTFRRHMLWHDNLAKTVQCEICGKVMSWSKDNFNLKRHKETKLCQKRAAIRAVVGGVADNA